MTHEDAIKILHPDTTFTALAEVEYYGGFNGQEAKIKAVEEACIIACEVLEKQIPKNPPNHDRMVCPSCNSKARYGHPYEYYCPHCGQAILWEVSE